MNYDDLDGGLLLDDLRDLVKKVEDHLNPNPDAHILRLPNFKLLQFLFGNHLLNLFLLPLVMTEYLGEVIHYLSESILFLLILR